MVHRLQDFDVGLAWERRKAEPTDAEPVDAVATKRTILLKM